MEWGSTETLIFIGLVFAAVALLTFSFVVPVFGESRAVRKRLQRRLKEMAAEDPGPARGVRRRQKPKSALEQAMEKLPGMAALAVTMEQAGYTKSVHQLVLQALGAATGIVLVVGLFIGHPGWAALAGVGVVMAAYAKLHVDRARRIAKFEEQLQDGVGVMVRALRAGHPFTQALRLVADDLEPPIGREFAIVFADINYGGDVRRALLGLLSRVPSVTVMALVTAVLVQRETGGNLAEILEKISEVTRARFRFQRRVKTLSAEARLSAWVLALVPLGLFAAISVTTPDYLPRLINDPLGQKLVVGAVVMGTIGIFWIRKLLRIQV
ncbi:type II secretion system F family protein [Thiohalomonas denitrificans]|uniref:Tight adherence protein B n=1 Tax=Thiohalomonas denitrificans TaxID=415747 RepID=A0A1G5QEQ7_9GAMM|nr:type II secretion system F family protein [Thiohalomonas denitrificans]SCZ60177.1 tight adherence protein B [Thiohalomonas denitrificans]